MTVFVKEKLMLITQYNNDADNTFHIIKWPDDTSDCSLPPPGLLPVGAHPRCHDGLDLHDHCCRAGTSRHCLRSFHPAQGAKKTKRQKDKKTNRQKDKITKTIIQKEEKILWS